MGASRPETATSTSRSDILQGRCWVKCLVHARDGQTEARRDTAVAGLCMIEDSNTGVCIWRYGANCSSLVIFGAPRFIILAPDL